MKITVVHNPQDSVEVTLVSNAFATQGYAYFVPENQGFLGWMLSLHQLEKEKNEWIRRYDNVLSGLRYWEARAKEKS